VTPHWAVEHLASRTAALDAILRGLAATSWQPDQLLSTALCGLRGNGEDLVEVTFKAWSCRGGKTLRLIGLVMSLPQRVALRWRAPLQRGEHVALPRRPPGNWGPRPGGWRAANEPRYTGRRVTVVELDALRRLTRE